MRLPRTATARFPTPETTWEPATAQRREGKIKAAMAWLREALKDGPRPGKELTDLAREQGHAPRTLAVARVRLHLHSVRQQNRYIWYTPSQWKQSSPKVLAKSR